VAFLRGRRDSGSSGEFGEQGCDGVSRCRLAVVEGGAWVYRSRNPGRRVGGSPRRPRGARPSRTDRTPSRALTAVRSPLGAAAGILEPLRTAQASPTAANAARGRGGHAAPRAGARGDAGGGRPGSRRGRSPAERKGPEPAESRSKQHGARWMTRRQREDTSGDRRRRHPRAGGRKRTGVGPCRLGRSRTPAPRRAHETAPYGVEPVCPAASDELEPGQGASTRLRGTGLLDSQAPVRVQAQPAPTAGGWQRTGGPTRPASSRSDLENSGHSKPAVGPAGGLPAGGYPPGRSAVNVALTGNARRLESVIRRTPPGLARAAARGAVAHSGPCRSAAIASGGRPRARRASIIP